MVFIFFFSVQNCIPWVLLQGLKVQIHCFVRWDESHPNLAIFGVEILLPGIPVCFEKLNIFLHTKKAYEFPEGSRLGVPTYLQDVGYRVTFYTEFICFKKAADCCGHAEIFPSLHLLGICILELWEVAWETSLALWSPLCLSGADLLTHGTSTVPLPHSEGVSLEPAWIDSETAL